MVKRNCRRALTLDLVRRYTVFLQEQEKSAATVRKYTHDLRLLCERLSGAELTKAMLIDWKKELTERYAAASVNTALAALNGLLGFCGWTDLRVKPLRIQKSIFCSAEQELSRAEYVRLIDAAERQNRKRLSLVIQTICATGIRVSELRFITAEAVRSGRAEICNKGKRRMVFLTEKLRRALKKYLKNQKRTAGFVFVTKTGNPLDRSNIWRAMKTLCKGAGVAPGKVFPHNLRRLFARTYYAVERDLLRLADILGHSDINTTRIYTAESGATHAKQMERMALMIT